MMTLDYLIDLHHDAPSSIGNKAKNIRFLIDKKFSVPRTWVCTWEAFERYRDNDVQIVEMLKAELALKLDPLRAYAVRSSANIEDDFQHSFAGQFKTVLNVQGTEAVLQAMWSIWALADAANVQAYLRKLVRDPRELKMAVIVQEMVQPVISGVAFSKNPMTGLDEIVVEAVRGRGDQLVQGGVTPARWVYKWGEWITQPESTAVPLEVIEEVVRGVKQIARAYGSPIDVEWVCDGQRVQWVQVREITTLQDLHIYSNRISREVMPGLIKPLIWSVNVPLVNGAWLRLFTELIGKNDLDPLSFSKSFYYRSYFNMSVIGDIMETLGMPRETLELLTGTQSSGAEKPRFKPTARTYRHLPRMLRAAIDKWHIGGKFERFVPAMWVQFRTFRYTEAASLSESQLLAAIDRLYPLVQETAYYNIVVPLLMQFYNRLLSQRLQQQGVDFAAFDLMRGLNEAQGYDPNFHLAQLRQGYDHQQVDAAERQAAITAFLERFGHLSDNGNDFSATPWREQPELVWKMIETQRLGGSPTHKLDPNDVRISGVTRLLYRRARQFRLYREMISSLYTYGYGLFRPYFRELGQRLMKRSLIERADDVFFLSFDEIRRAVTTNQEVDDLRSQTTRRRQEMDRVRDVIPPSIIYGDTPAPIETQPGDKLIGTPTARGYYQGTARVVRGIKDFEKVQAGDVLIVPFSDVGWTPLFSRAGAVIAESGGMLSHSSIVAREYDVPAVVSVSGACQIPDGTLVTVDAYRGEVIIHAEKLSGL
jgi:phosphohistidine swiveling domain-containing protein